MVVLNSCFGLLMCLRCCYFGWFCSLLLFVDYLRCLCFLMRFGCVLDDLFARLFRLGGCFDLDLACCLLMMGLAILLYFVFEFAGFFMGFGYFVLDWFVLVSFTLHFGVSLLS